MENTHKLPNRFFNRNMEGKRIPHEVNPGPQSVCPSCKLTRFGSDFVATGSIAKAPVCKACYPSVYGIK